MTRKVATHQLKRQARKEAWYGDSWNPWRKNIRSMTFNSTNSNDLERGPRENELKSSPQKKSEETDSLQNPNSKDEIKPKTQKIQGRNSNSSQEFVGEVANDSSLSQTSARLRAGGDSSNKEATSLQRDEEDYSKKKSWFKGKEFKHKSYTFQNQIQATLFNSWINILLLAAPAGIICNYMHLNGTIIFIVNFIAIVPLAGLLGFATEEIALHLGESLGGLLNASFGNAVEIIVAVIALTKDEIVVVQTSLIGSILSNLLLVMGMCFFFGGLRRSEQYFNQVVAQTSASLLALSIASIVIPTCFGLFTNSDKSVFNNIASLSRGTSVILLMVYGAYLFFQLYTHQSIFNTESQKVAIKPSKRSVAKGAVFKGLATAGGVGAGAGRPHLAERLGHDELLKYDACNDDDDEEEEPQLHIAVAWATLAGATAIIGLCAEFMVDGISSITSGGKVSVEFVGLILLPIVGNAAEHATAVTVAVKDKMDLAIGVAVGSSMQIALLVIPLVVVIGWIMGKEDMSLSFDGFQVAILFVSVLLVNYLISDGKSHWLEGMLLMCLYLRLFAPKYLRRTWDLWEDSIMETNLKIKI